MAISVIASNSAVGTGTVTVTKPAGTADGHLMVAFLTADNIATYAALTAPAGWTLRGGLDSGANKSPVKVFTKTAASEGSSYAFGVTAGEDGCCIITTLSGVTTNISDWVFSFSFDTSTGTTRTAPSVNGTGEMLLSYAMISQNGAASTVTVPSGMTVCGSNGTGYIAAGLAYTLSPTNPTGTKSWTFGHAADFGGVTGTLLLAQPATVTNPGAFFPFFISSSGYATSGGGGGGGGSPTTLLVPSNWRAKGANLTFNFSDGNGSLGAEGGSWVNFTSNYSTWWQPQIDDAAAIGINCLRIWGSPQPVGDGYISLSTYLSRWETVLDYCATKGIKVYPCGGDLDRWGSISDTDAVSLYSSWAAMLAGHSNVIGVDLTNEVWAKCDPINPGGRTQSDLLTFLGRLKDAVNAQGLPATNSQGITYQGGGWTLDTWNGVSKAPFYDMSDFIDYHLYWPWPYQRPSGTPNGDYMSDIYTSSTLGPAVAGKQVFFGEFGCLPTDSDRATLYPGIKDLINASTNHLGGCAWALWDYSTDPSWKWGLYSTSGFPSGPFSRSLRTDISTQFASFPTTR